MLGRNSRLSKNVQKSQTPRQKMSNVEASNEMKSNTKNCKSCSNSSKAQNKSSSKSSTSARNCK